MAGLGNAQTYKTGGDVRLCLPDTFYVAAGQECEIRFDNYILSRRSLIFDAVADSGTLYEDRFQWTPDAATDFDLNITVNIYDDQYNKLDTDDAVISCNVISAVGAHTLIGWGNSLFAGKILLSVIDTLYSNDANLTWLGTQSGGDAAASEAYSGRTPTWFATDAASPFVTASAVDIQAYLTGEGYADPNLVLVMQGTAAFTGSKTLLTIANATVFLDDLDLLLQGFITDCPGVEIGVYYTPPPSSQSGFGNAYGADRLHWIAKSNLHLWNECLKAKYGIGGTDEHDQITLIPANMDAVNNFPTTTVQVNSRNATTETIQTDTVHPASPGFKQLADQGAGWIASKW